MYAEIKQIIARKNDSPPGSLQQQQQQQQKGETPLDAVQLTSILSASGFHLDHFDIDRSRRRSTTTTNSTTDAHQPPADILVEITCQQSGIVSRMHHAPSRCTCPAEEECTRRSAIWDVQTAGGGGTPNRTANGQRSAAGEVSVRSSSNLLPQLSPRKVQITKHLLKVMLEVFEAQDENGNTIPSKSTQPSDVDQLNNNPTNANGAHSPLPTDLAPPTPSNGGFLTPVSSVQVTPMKPDDFVAEVVGMPKVLLNGSSNAAALAAANANNNNTLSAVSFASPGSDMFTSSPNASQIKALPVHERDQVVASLRQIRLNIDNTLAFLDFDNTRTISTPIDRPSTTAAKSAASKMAAAKTAATRALIAQPPNATGASARRHSLSAMPGVKSSAASAAGGRLATIASASAGRSSIGGGVTMRRPAEPSTATNRRSLQPVKTTTTSGAAGKTLGTTPHVATPRPAPPTSSTAAGRTVTPRISLVARNSTGGGGGSASKTAAATAAPASKIDSKTFLQRNPLTRSLTRLASVGDAASGSTSKTASPTTSGPASLVEKPLVD